MLARINAGRLAVLKGLEIKDTFGDALAEYIRAGGTRVGAIEEFNIEEKIDLTHDVAVVAVRHALAGSNGRYGIHYTGLIPKLELEHLDKKAREYRGDYALTRGKGIYGLSAEKRFEAQSNGGKEARAQKKGIHGLTEKEDRKNKILAIRARGREPWTDAQKAWVYRISENREYQDHSHHDLRKIAMAYARRYGIKRTPVSIGQLLTHHKKEITRRA